MVRCGGCVVDSSGGYMACLGSVPEEQESTLVSSPYPAESSERYSGSTGR